MRAQNTTARILIVDDDEDDFIITREYVQSIPGKNFAIDWSNTYNDGVKHLLAHERRC
jgi:hypothetical protein